MSTPPAADPPADPPPAMAHPLRRGDRLRAYVTREWALLIALALVAGGLFLFLKIASEVSEGDTLALDRAVLLALRQTTDLSRPLGPGWLNEAMTDITAFGSTTGLLLVIVVVAGYLLVARRPWTAGFVIAATAGGALFGALLKLIYERPRPDIVPHLVDVTHASFPSGHTTDSAIVYLTLAALLARTARRRLERLYLIGAAMALTVAIGVSRMYLGVHWPTDVLAGWTVGCTWALLCSLLYHHWQRRQARAQGSLADGPRHA